MNTPDPVRVLIVDDQMSNLLAIEQVISELDARISKTTSANEALLIIMHHQIDCILVDISMPEMDGLEFLKLVRSDPTHKYVPVIMVTGKIYSDNEMQKAYRFGAVDFLFKPVDAEVLLQKVGFIVQQAIRLKRVSMVGASLAALEQECIEPLLSIANTIEDTVVQKQISDVVDRLQVTRMNWENFNE